MPVNIIINNKPQIIFVLSFLLFVFYVKDLSAQGVPIGHWRHHLPNNNIVSIADSPEKIIGANPYGLVIYNKKDNSIEKFNKVHGLSDLGISQIVYAAENSILFIAYENGNIDLKQNNKVFNIPDIKRAPIIGSKGINNVQIIGNTAYIATDFGIVNLNLSDLTIRDTYFIGFEGSQINVNDLLFTEKNIFAATEGGIFIAERDAPNLADFNYWRKMEDLPVKIANYNFIKVFNDYLFVNMTLLIDDEIIDTLYYHDGNKWNTFLPEGEDYFQQKRRITTSKDKLIIVTDSFVDVFDSELNRLMHVEDYYDGTPNPYDAVIDNDNMLWIADESHGIVKMTSATTSVNFQMRGLSSSNSFALASSMDNIWVAPGTITSRGVNTWNYNGFFRFTDERWRTYNRFGYDELIRVFDIINISVDPRNPRRVVASSWYDGIVIFEDYEVVSKYGIDNMAMHTLQLNLPREDFMRISDTKFDRNGNLWVANAQTINPLSVRKPDGKWLSFNIGGLVSPSWLTGEMIIDDHNQKWMIFPDGNGIIIFKENSLDNNNNYEVKRLTTAEGNGGLPSNYVTAIAKDQNGYIWVSTSKGVVVFYSPHRALTGEPFDAYPIILEEDRFAGLLFENETVNSITVDGSNKKWFATSRAGAFLMTSDAQQTIHHFDAENSPLPSNTVRDIAVEPKTGEVFFATDRGIASYRAFATEGQKQHTDVFAFPNPVRPNYNGYIAINGLVRNANVKITDINGNLVYETIAEGGQAVWDGYNIRGKKPGSGVYLVFSTNEDGSETVVTKILFLN